MKTVSLEAGAPLGILLVEVPPHEDSPIHRNSANKSVKKNFFKIATPHNVMFFMLSDFPYYTMPIVKLYFFEYAQNDAIPQIFIAPEICAHPDRFGKVVAAPSATDLSAVKFCKSIPACGKLLESLD